VVWYLAEAELGALAGGDHREAAASVHVAMT
jgi:hypothetical protein